MIPWEGRTGRRKGSWPVCSQWKRLLSLNKGNYCFERCDWTGLVARVICRPQEWGRRPGKGVVMAFPPGRRAEGEAPLLLGRAPASRAMLGVHLGAVSSAPPGFLHPLLPLSTLNDFRSPVDPKCSQLHASRSLLMLSLGLEGHHSVVGRPVRWHLLCVCVGG